MEDFVSFINQICGVIAVVYCVAELLFMNPHENLRSLWVDRNPMQLLRVATLFVIGLAGALLFGWPESKNDEHAAWQVVAHIALALWCLYGLMKDVQAARSGNPLDSSPHGAPPTPQVPK